jgi:hypothetical protein
VGVTVSCVASQVAVLHHFDQRISVHNSSPGSVHQEGPLHQHVLCHILRTWRIMMKASVQLERKASKVIRVTGRDNLGCVMNQINASHQKSGLGISRPQKLPKAKLIGRGLI